MGIQVEFNPDLCLRRMKHFLAGGRHPSECIPRDLTAGGVYHFLKHGQRNYWLGGEIPLYETEGSGPVGRPVASIRILEATHFCDGSGHVYTKGKYRVEAVFSVDDPMPRFEGFARINRQNDESGGKKPA